MLTTLFTYDSKLKNGKNLSTAPVAKASLIHTDVLTQFTQEDDKILLNAVYKIALYFKVTPADQFLFLVAMFGKGCRVPNFGD